MTKQIKHGEKRKNHAKSNGDTKNQCELIKTEILSASKMFERVNTYHGW